MKQSKNFKPLRWAVGLLAVLLMVASGATYAALQSQPGVLKGNTIQTAIASLQVSPDGTSYSNVMDGYVFGNLIPGGQPTPTSGYPVYLKNVGTTALALRLSVNPAVNNPSNVDLSKVHIILTSTSGGAPQNISLQDLIAASSTGGLAVSQASRINPSQITSFMIQVSLDSDAVSGPTATLSNIDFNFGALAVN